MPADELKRDRRALSGEAGGKGNRGTAGKIEGRGEAQQLDHRLRVLAQRGHVVERRRGHHLRRNHQEIDVLEQRAHLAGELVPVQQDLLVL